MENQTTAIYRLFKRIAAHSSRFSSHARTTSASVVDGFIPPTKRARCCLFDTGCIHPNFKPREGHLWYPTSSNRLCCCRRPPDHDSGTFSFTLRRRASDPHLSRILWPTIRTTLSLGGLALVCAKHCTGDRREDGRTNSPRPPLTRLEILPRELYQKHARGVVLNPLTDISMQNPD